MDAKDYPAWHSPSFLAMKLLHVVALYKRLHPNKLLVRGRLLHSGPPSQEEMERHAPPLTSKPWDEDSAVEPAHAMTHREIFSQMNALTLTVRTPGLVELSSRSVRAGWVDQEYFPREFQMPRCGSHHPYPPLRLRHRGIEAGSPVPNLVSPLLSQISIKTPFSIIPTFYSSLSSLSLSFHIVMNPQRAECGLFARVCAADQGWRRTPENWVGVDHTTFRSSLATVMAE